uniref:Uncharacterized protein n=1 Tax=Brassica oleracea var. oleracea TaxID=109376 RepID=A0A0D3BH28_BRAOL
MAKVRVFSRAFLHGLGPRITDNGISVGDSTLGVVDAAAQRSRHVVPSLRGETDEYMIFGRIGATELFIQIFLWD